MKYNTLGDACYYGVLVLGVLALATGSLVLAFGAVALMPGVLWGMYSEFRQLS